MRRRQQPEATPEEEEHDEDEYETDDGEGEGEDGESEYEPVDANEAAAETEEDDEEEEEEEEEEEDEESFQPWMGIRLLPEREAVLEALAHYKDSGRKQLTVLLIGKSGMGKSSTCNSVLNESAARVSAFKLQADTETTTPLARTLMGLPEGSPDVEGLRVKFIDTCGLEDPEAGDTINYGGLERMAEDLNGQSIDAVLYVDRLDMYRVEPLDRRIFDSITNMFGRDIWRKTIIALTHGNMRQPPPGTTYDDFVTRRVQLLRRAMRRPFGRAPLPYVLIENSESCPQDITRCRVLPDGPWIVNVVEELVDMALRGRPYVYRPHMTSRPNKRYQWLLPLIVYGQYFVFRQYLEPRIKRDMELQDKHDDDVWKEKAKERKRLGIGPPLMPSKETKWRLEQMYDDD